MAGVATVAGLLPVVLNLPRVSVVACFDSGHPLYQWVATPELGTAHCLSAPRPVVSWTLMIAATLVVQLLGLPVLLAAGAVLVRGARSLRHSTGRALTSAFVSLTDLIIPRRSPALVPVPVRVVGSRLSSENPRRGPPARRS